MGSSILGSNFCSEVLPAANFLSSGASSFLTDSLGSIRICKSNFTQNNELLYVRRNHCVGVSDAEECGILKV